MPVQELIKRHLPATFVDLAKKTNTPEQILELALSAMVRGKKVVRVGATYYAAGAMAREKVYERMYTEDGRPRNQKGAPWMCVDCGETEEIRRSASSQSYCVSCKSRRAMRNRARKATAELAEVRKVKATGVVNDGKTIQLVAKDMHKATVIFEMDASQFDQIVNRSA
jgi:hypothetical protein